MRALHAAQAMPRRLGPLALLLCCLAVTAASPADPAVQECAADAGQSACTEPHAQLGAAARELAGLLRAAEDAHAALGEAIARAKTVLGSPAAAQQAAAAQPADGALALLPQQPLSRFGFAGDGALQAQAPGPGRTIARALPAWSDFFAFVSAVRTEAPVLACALVKGSHGGPPRFLAAGDASGRIYLITPAGEVVWEHDAGAGVTALATHAPAANASVLVAGLASGRVLMLRVEQRLVRREGVEYAAVERVTSAGSFGGPAAAEEGADAPGEGSDAVAEGGAAVTHLALLPAGGRSHHYAAAHANGSLHLWRPDGSLRQAATLQQPLRLLQPLAGKLLLLHAGGAAVWPLSGGAQPQPPLRQVPCAGLNGSVLLAAAFQPSKGAGSGRFFALSDAGELLTLGGPLLTRCQVASAVQTGLPVAGPLQLAALPGFLLLHAPSFVALFNTSGAVYRFGPRGVMAASLADVAMTGGLLGSAVAQPAAAASAHLAALTVTPGVLLLLRPKLESGHRAAQGTSLLAYSRPAIILLAGLLAAWRFNSNRHRERSLPFPTRRQPDLQLSRGQDRSRQLAAAGRAPPWQRASEQADWGSDAADAALARPWQRVGQQQHAIRQLAAQLDAEGLSRRSRQAAAAAGPAAQEAAACDGDGGLSLPACA